MSLSYLAFLQNDSKHFAPLMQELRDKIEEVSKLREPVCAKAQDLESTAESDAEWAAVDAAWNECDPFDAMLNGLEELHTFLAEYADCFEV